jgi:hypothetical protein
MPSQQIARRCDLEHSVDAPIALKEHRTTKVGNTASSAKRMESIMGTPLPPVTAPAPNTHAALAPASGKAMTPAKPDAVSGGNFLQPAAPLGFEPKPNEKLDPLLAKLDDYERALASGNEKAARDARAVVSDLADKYIDKQVADVIDAAFSGSVEWIGMLRDDMHDAVLVKAAAQGDEGAREAVHLDYNTEVASGEFYHARFNLDYAKGQLEPKSDPNDLSERPRSLSQEDLERLGNLEEKLTTASAHLEKAALAQYENAVARGGDDVSMTRAGSRFVRPDVEALASSGKHCVEDSVNSRYLKEVKSEKDSNKQAAVRNKGEKLEKKAYDEAGATIKIATDLAAKAHHVRNQEIEHFAGYVKNRVTAIRTKYEEERRKPD